MFGRSSVRFKFAQDLNLQVSPRSLSKSSLTYLGRIDGA